MLPTKKKFRETVKIKQDNVKTCSFVQTKILKINESNKSIEASKMRFMRLVAAETLQNRRRGYKFTVKLTISGCRNRLFNEFDMTDHSCASKTALN